MSDPVRPRRYAVIPTYNRPDVLLRSLAAATAESDYVLVLDNGDDPALMVTPPKLESSGWGLLQVPMRPPNLSHLWDVGITLAARDARYRDLQQWDVAVLNDDAIIPPGWYHTLSTRMRETGCAAASTGLLDGTPTGNAIIHRTPGTTALSQRMQGHAFLLRGEADLRPDRNLQWWCGDNDLDMQARAWGGTLVMAGLPVQHLYPDQSTRGELAARTGIDMAYFVEKWKFRPW